MQTLTELTERENYTDRELVALLNVGSPVAFNILLDRYSPRVYRFAMSYLKNRQDAEEIVQEVFLKIWKIKEELSPEKSLDSFLFTIAKNGILNTIRKARSQQAYLNYAVLYPEKKVLVDDELDFRELEKACKMAVDRLSPKRKEIYRLSREKFLSNAEIAAHLGISVKTVENQMTSALSEIRRTLRSLGFSFLFIFRLFM
jgi:RNA polymerase sigma-70 factor (ECF subfamily)